jgi:hypothetical protein
MHESTCEEDVKKTAPLDASYPTMRVNSDSKNQPNHNRKSDVHESTYQEDVMNKTYRENRMSAMHEGTYQEDVMENVNVSGAVANTGSSNYGPEEPQNNSMTGTEDNTKRLAVIAIASERGGRGHN